VAEENEKTTVNIKLSKRQVKYRVINRNGMIIFSTPYYESAAQYCWDYDGPEPSISIDKVWIKKGVTGL